jgi:hypothetical protein
MDRALYDLAEACRGFSPEMRWSTNEDIARRESRRLFERCAKREIEPGQALEVFLATMEVKFRASLAVIEERYNFLLIHLNQEEQVKLNALKEFTRFFSSAHPDAEYTTSADITRQELRPLFELCYSGVLSPIEAQDAVFDNVTAKKETSFEALTAIAQRLVAELVVTGIAAEVLMREKRIKVPETPTEDLES